MNKLSVRVFWLVYILFIAFGISYCADIYHRQIPKRIQSAIDRELSIVEKSLSKYTDIVVITLKDDGSQFKVRNGQKIRVELREYPSTELFWEYTEPIYIWNIIKPNDYVYGDSITRRFHFMWNDLKDGEVKMLNFILTNHKKEIVKQSFSISIALDTDPQVY
jgi:hypothetical protein